MNLNFIQRNHIMKDVYLQVRSFIKKIWKPKKNVDGAVSRKEQTPIGFLHRRLGVKKNE